MRCSLILFVSLFALSHAAPVKIFDGMSGLRVSIPNQPTGQGDQNQGYNYGTPSVRDMPSPEGDIEPGSTTSPVSKKPRNNSRLSDPTPRSVEVVGALKASESKRSNVGISEGGKHAAGPRDTLEERYVKKPTFHILPVESPIPMDPSLPTDGEVIPVQKRSGFPFFDNLNEGIGSAFAGGSVGGAAPRDAPSDDVVSKRGTTSHFDSDENPSAGPHPITGVRIPQAVYKRDGDDSTVA